MPEKKSQTLTCSACGAPLDYDGKSPTVVCKFCKNVTLVEGFKEEPPIQVIVEERKAESKPAAPVIIDLPVRPVDRGAAKRSGYLGCGIALVVLLFVGGALALAFAQPGGPFVPRMVAMDPAALLPAEGETPPDAVSLFYHVTDETRLVARVSTSGSKLVWQAEPLPGDGYVEGIITDGNRVYAASGMDLFAYRAEDGSLAWQVKMPDQLDYGDSSLVLAGGRVVAMTLDRSLQAYDAATGGLVWSRVLGGYDREIRRMGDQIMVMDYLGDDYVYSLIFLNPADGQEEIVLTPTCPYSEFSSDSLDPESGIFQDEAQNSLYVFYDTFTGCIERLDMGSGQVTWQTYVEDGFSFSPYGFNGLMTDSAIYFQNKDTLLAVDKASGEVKILLADEDYEFIPLVLSGEALVVRARRTRGTERFELWGVAADRGGKQWSIELENAKPIDPPNELVGLVDEDESGWTWRMTPAGLLLLDFQAAPNQLVLTTIDPASGASLGELTVEVKESSVDFYSVPTVIGWWNQVVYFSLDASVYAVDVTSGEILVVYQ